jgi:hypothetical protein
LRRFYALHREVEADVVWQKESLDSYCLNDKKQKSMPHSLNEKSGMLDFLYFKHHTIPYQ